MIKKRMRMFIGIFMSLLIIGNTVLFAIPAKAEASYIDNSDLMPKYVTDDNVALVDGAPDWISSMVMLQCRISYATQEGTLESAVKVLDHCREMGVNALWLCPVAESGDPSFNNTYYNLGPHTIDPIITGTEDYEQGWQKLKSFIDEAHSRDVRIILDMVTWGTANGAPLITEHPDWFEGEAWGGTAFNWKNEEFKEWYINQLVNIAVETGCDGFRMDCEPNYAGYDVNREIYGRLLAQGRKVLMISEDTNVRDGAFHLEQTGVKDATKTMTEIYNSPKNIFIDNYNIVDCVKNGQNIGDESLQAVGRGGTFRYYTNCLTVHDSRVDNINGNKLAIGYQAIYAPFIPIWVLSQEWMDELNGALYFTHQPDWDALDNEENREFYESVKRMIRIRRTYSDVFEYWPENHQESNICAVDVEGNEGLQAYARYNRDTAVLIIPNNNVQNTTDKFTVCLPLEEMGLMYYNKYTVTDAVTGEEIISGSMGKVRKFMLDVPLGDMRTLVVKGSDRTTPATKVDYITPVLTTEEVTGNTIYTLEQSKSNWSKYFTTDPSNLENNTGIHYDWTYEAGNSVQNGINQQFKFDGVSVKLANIGNAENAGSKRFALVFSSKSKNAYSATNGALRILFNGRLGYATVSANGRSVNILGDDTATPSDGKNAIFKDICDKVVCVDIQRKTDNTGAYIITLTIGDQVLTDTLPAYLLEGLDFDPAGQCYVSLSAVNITGQAATSIDFLGVGQRVVIEPEKHNGLSYTVPVLTTEDITGNTIHTLAQSKSNWSKYFTKDPSNLENNTGIHYEWVEGAGNGVANGINKKFDFDGASVKLANIGNAENAGSKRFALVFSSKNNTSYSATNGVLRILFNGRLGYATAAANGQSVNILGDDTATATDEKNAIFKNMSDKTVYVDIAKKADDTGDYEINLTIGDNVLTDTLPASLLTGLDFDPAGQCYITLSAVNITGQAATSIDFLGVGNSKAQVSAYAQAGLYLDGEEPTAIKSAAIVKNGSLINNYGSTTQSSQGIELTVKATYGFGNGMEISVNGFSLKMSGTGFILNGEAINVVLNELGVYDIIFKVEPIFSNNGTTNTLITANINGIIYSSVSELVSEKTYEGIVIDNRYSGKTITIIPTAIMTLKGESEFVIDRVKHVLYVSDETDINVIKEKLDTTGFAFADGTVKTGMTVTRSGCAVYTVSLKDDVNGDGFVNVIDLVRLKKAAAQAVTLTDAQEYSVGIADTGVVKAENLNGMRKVILQS